MTVMTTSLPSAPPPSWKAEQSEVFASQSSMMIRSAALPDRQKNVSDRQSTELLALFRDNAFERHFQPNSTLLLHGDPADAIYLVVSGTVRCCTIDSNGNRQIFSFPKTGGLVGISDMDYWHFTAEAVDHVIVKSLPRSVLEQELAVNIALQQEIRAYMRGLLAQRERQLLVLSSTQGPERLYHFLQDFAATRPATGFVVLPMCRRDIADHIGLSTEGVSRAFGHLKRSGLIDLKSCERYRIAPRSGDSMAQKAQPILA